jgi:hypothetical protein
MLTLKILVYTTIIFFVSLLSLFKLRDTRNLSTLKTLRLVFSFLDFFQVIHHEIQIVKILNNYKLSNTSSLCWTSHSRYKNSLDVKEIILSYEGIST